MASSFLLLVAGLVGFYGLCHTAIADVAKWMSVTVLLIALSAACALMGW